jgi:hypothetical protein
VSAEPIDLKAVDLLMAVQEAIDLPHAATVGDNQIRRAALEERAAHAAITLHRVLDPEGGGTLVWEALDLRARLAALPARPYTTWAQAHGQPRPGREGGPS